MNWKNYTALPPEFQKQKVFDGCGISGYLNIDGTRDNGKKIIDMLCILSERENGLGAGFAGYGIYPNFEEYYALHFLFDHDKCKKNVIEFLERKGYIIHSEPIPTSPPKEIENPPITWRVFYEPKNVLGLSHDEEIMNLVMEINEKFEGAFIMSSGKNMGVFKGNGWSHEIAEIYKIEEYKAYMWLAHSRFPTNTPGWWGGAHPFNLLNTSVVHNGEITSYGTNMRYLESFRYKCTLHTDTEVIAYLFDLLGRKHRIPLPITSLVLSPPLFKEIEELKEEYRITLKNLRATYRSAMLNGPFSIIVGTANPVPSLIGLSDRKKLRPLVAALSEDENTVFLSSEEASFRRLQLDKPDGSFDFKEIWHPKSGTVVIAQVGRGLIRDGTETPFEKIELKIEAPMEVS
ncbi:MAG: glutamine amidotransferase family protein [Promethearchaeia archaeon]